MTPPVFRPALLAVGIAAALAAPAAFAQTSHALATAAVAATPPAAAPSAALVSGLDGRGRDDRVRPQDDLFSAMNGGWFKATAIPADKPEWGAFSELEEQSDHHVKTLVDGLVAQPQAAGGNGQKIADYYRSYMDTAAIDKAGLAPIEAMLKEAADVRDAKGLSALMGRWQHMVALPVRSAIGPDAEHPEVYALDLGQGGLGLPDRDYYLKDDPRFAAARAAYVAHLGKVFELAGDAQPAAQAHAQAVMALETKIAKAQWSQVEQRDPKKVYNPKTPEQLAKLAPGIAWADFDAGAGIPRTTAIVAQPSYFAALSGLMKSEPLASWKLYMRVHALDAMAEDLPAGFRDAYFDFYGKVLNGMEQPRARWQLALDELGDNLGEAVGQLYVAQYFPPESKARVRALVDNLMKAYATSIDDLAWMSPETKKAAHEKLSKYAIKIGYPDKWRDYSALEIKPGDPLGNGERAILFERARQMARVGKPVDRTEWGMTPQTVNAYYEPTRNEIVFPAAILQPPFFNPAADDAVNYGGIGAVIGHEISHGFDDEGSQFDGDGRLRNWWTDADRKAFEAITSRLVAQYASYEPLPGKHLDGKLTLGENIADLSGVQIAFKAYEISLGGKPSPVIDDMTGEQRFYYGFAQVWREKTRDEFALQSIVMNPHSPGRFRADGATINSDGFHQAFGTKPGDAMWKAPEDRIRLW